MLHLVDEGTTAGEHARLAQGSGLGPVLFCVIPRPLLFTKAQDFSFQKDTERQMWPFNVSSASLLREKPAEILIGLRNNFSESIFFKLYVQNSAKSFFFFFPEKCQLPREFRQKFAQIIDNSVHGYRGTPLIGDISYYFMLQLRKSSHCLASVTSTAMTSEADADPLTPVGQFSLSESHSSTYHCVSQFH